MKRVCPLLLMLFAFVAAAEPPAVTWVDGVEGALQHARTGGSEVFLWTPAAEESAPEAGPESLRRRFVWVRPPAADAPAILGRLRVAPTTRALLLDPDGRVLARWDSTPANVYDHLPAALEAEGRDALERKDGTGVCAAWGLLEELFPDDPSLAQIRARWEEAGRDEVVGPVLAACRREWQAGARLAQARRALAAGRSADARPLLAAIEHEFPGTRAVVDSRELLARLDATGTPPDPTRLKHGRILFADKMCNSCHQVRADRGILNGPNLAGIAARVLERTGSEEAARAWLRNHLAEPERYPGPDKDHFMVKMPAVPMTEEEREVLTDYLMSLR